MNNASIQDRYLDLLIEGAYERQEAQAVMREIMEAIKSVPDDVQQTILIERYINGRRLQDIQKDIHYEKRNTIIIHGRALWEVWQYMKRKGLCE